MVQITCLENILNKDHSQSTSFRIEPLEIGQAITLGNSLRRVLLSDLTDYGIKGIKINDIKNEYSSIPFVREDPLEIIANLKQILFCESILTYQDSKVSKNFRVPAFLFAAGPKIITAGLIKLPKNTLTIINPEQYICTVIKHSDFYCELDIGKSKEFHFKNSSDRSPETNNFSPAKPKTILIDYPYSPVINVGFKVKLIYDSQGNLKEALQLEIITKGTKSPKRCLQEALKSLSDLFYSLLGDSLALHILSDISKKIKDK